MRKHMVARFIDTVVDSITAVEDVAVGLCRSALSPFGQSPRFWLSDLCSPSYRPICLLGCTGSDCYRHAGRPGVVPAGGHLLQRVNLRAELER